MVCNLDSDFERHNIFLTMHELTALPRSAATAFLDVADTPVANALLSDSGHDRQLAQLTSNRVPTSTLP